MTSCIHRNSWQLTLSTGSSAFGSSCCSASCPCVAPGSSAEPCSNNSYMTVGMHPARFVCARFDFDSQFWNGVDSRHFFVPLHLVKLWLSKYPNEASRLSHDTTIWPCPNQSEHSQTTFKTTRSLWVISSSLIQPWWVSPMFPYLSMQQSMMIPVFALFSSNLTNMEGTCSDNSKDSKERKLRWLNDSAPARCAVAWWKMIQTCWGK